MKVAFYTNMPSPYRVAFFNLLGRHCDLYVFFEMDKSKTRDDNWQAYNFEYFHGIFLKGVSYSGEAAFCPEIVRQYKKLKPDINVVCNMSSLTGIKLLNYFIRNKIEYVIEGDGAFLRKCSGLKRRLKTKFVSNASRLFYTSDEHKRYLIEFGGDESKMFHYPFSSIHFQDIISLKDLDSKKKEMKRKFGLNGFVFLTVGRFLAWKNFETILSAFPSVQNQSSLILIGGEPPENYLDIIRKNNIQHVSFLPFMNTDKLYEYMLAADCFVFSSVQDVWGLVINEAMAHGLPVISSRGTLSAVEMAKNNDGIWLFDPVDVDSLSELMGKMCLLNADERKRIGRLNLERVRLYTLETMCEAHVNYLLTMLQK